MYRDTSYRFAGFTLVPSQRQLLKGAVEVALRPKSFHTLVCLVERRGEVVTKDELLNLVWPDVNVSEEVLTHCIAEVRGALSDDSRHPRFVKTISRHGYKFIADTSRVGAADPGAARPAPPTGGDASAPPASAIVVLPFANISDDPGNEYLCDGLAEELINALTKVGGLQVVAHSSSFSFKGRDVDAREIGRQLQAGTILEGSVRKTGDRLRVSAQLIDAARGYHLWSEQYDRRLEDIFALQDELARAILDNLKPALFERPVPPAKPSSARVEAYLLHLQGRAFWHQRYGGFLERAMDCFGRAIAADPGFAPSYAGLADSLAVQGIWGLARAHEVYPKASASAALALDPRLAEAHASRAQLRMFWDWEWHEAERGLRRGLELNPGSAFIRLLFGHYLSIVGRMEDALAEMRTARTFDPLSPICGANVGFTCHLAHRQDEAIGELQRVLARTPENGLALFYLGWALIAVGRHDEAIEALGRAHAVTRGMPFSFEGIGLAHALAGRRDRARAILAEVQARSATAYTPSSAFAALLVGLDDHEGALGWLERAVDERDAMLPWLRFMPCFDGLHAQPRFRTVLGRIGLLPPSPAGEPIHTA